MFGRIAFFLLLGTLALCASALVFDWRITIPEDIAETIGWREGMTDEQVVDADLAWHMNDEKIAGRLEDAVARDDYADTMLWLEIARKAGIPLAGGLEAAAYSIGAREDSFDTQLSDFLTGFATGEADSLAGLGGAVTSDLTVYGDLRDITIEGGKMVAGEEYSQFILGLSAVGIAATAGTIATGGGGVVVKAGVSFVKFAKRSGQMTAGFAARLLRLSDEAIDLPGLKNALRSINLADPAGSWTRLSKYLADVKDARIFKVLGKMEDIRAEVGTVEALRLMKRMEKIEDADDIYGIAKAAGKRTRGVMTLTGKTSFRAIKYTANLVQILFEYVWGFLMWIGGLLAAILLKILISLWRIGRFAVRRARRKRVTRPAAARTPKARGFEPQVWRLPSAPERQPRLTVS
ncbi:MAG: hypothetical protein QM698_16560 [Micropepsaceae bacterium]